MLVMVLMVGIIIILALLFGIMVLKDKESTAKFIRFEKTIEGILRENYEIKKQLDRIKEHNLNTDTDEIKNLCFQHIDTQLRDKTMPMLATLQELKQKIQQSQDEQQSRIFNLEERTRDFNKIAPPSPESESEEILRLYKSGKSLESIAKDMQLGIGRVEFVLKMQGMVY